MRREQSSSAACGAGAGAGAGATEICRTNPSLQLLDVKKCKPASGHQLLIHSLAYSIEKKPPAKTVLKSPHTPSKIWHAQRRSRGYASGASSTVKKLTPIDHSGGALALKCFDRPAAMPTQEQLDRSVTVARLLGDDQAGWFRRNGKLYMVSSYYEQSLIDELIKNRDNKQAPLGCSPEKRIELLTNLRNDLNLLLKRYDYVYTDLKLDNIMIKRDAKGQITKLVLTDTEAAIPRGAKVGGNYTYGYVPIEICSAITQGRKLRAVRSNMDFAFMRVVHHVLSDVTSCIFDDVKVASGDEHGNAYDIQGYTGQVKKYLDAWFSEVETYHRYDVSFVFVRDFIRHEASGIDDGHILKDKVKKIQTRRLSDGYDDVDDYIDALFGLLDDIKEALASNSHTDAERIATAWSRHSLKNQLIDGKRLYPGSRKLHGYKNDQYGIRESCSSVSSYSSSSSVTGSTTTRSGSYTDSSGYTSTGSDATVVSRARASRASTNASTHSVSPHRPSPKSFIKYCASVSIFSRHRANTPCVKQLFTRVRRSRSVDCRMR